MGGTRALSSADESGPVTKKLRSSSRQHQISAKPSILQDDGQKKVGPTVLTMSTVLTFWDTSP